MGIRFDANEVKGDYILEEMKARNVYASIRGNSIRIAPHLHVNEKDIDTFVEVVGDVMSKFKKNVAN